MSNVEWDSKVVIGHKAKAPKVTRTTSDLNGASHAPAHGLLPCRDMWPNADGRVLQLYVVSGRLYCALTD